MSRSAESWYQTVALRLSLGGGPKPARAGSPWVLTLTQPASNAVGSRVRLGRARIGDSSWDRDCGSAPCARCPLYRIAKQFPDCGEARAGALLLALGVGDRVGAVALQLGGRQFVQEAARRQAQLLAPALRLAGVRQPQRALRTGDADVEQAPFLVQATLLDAGLVRQVAVLDADDEHVVELQALGRVQAHQPDLVAGVALVGVREQRQCGGEVARTGIAPAVEPVCELVEVAPARLELGLV